MQVVYVSLAYFTEIIQITWCVVFRITQHDELNRMGTAEGRQFLPLALLLKGCDYKKEQLIVKLHEKLIKEIVSGLVVTPLCLFHIA